MSLGCMFSHMIMNLSLKNLHIFEKFPKLKKDSEHLVISRHIYMFIWKSKYTGSQTGGGLNMLDFTLFDKALKITRVKRLCANDKRPWRQAWPSG